MKFVKTILYATGLLTLSGGAQGTGDFERIAGLTGKSGGNLVVGQRSEAKTLNPVTAIDGPSREVIRRMTADLITIDRESQMPAPALAKSWSVSKDGLHYTLNLRRGIRFSDGQSFDAADVLFTFAVYLDEKVRSPQRDLLMIGDQPLRVRKLDDFTVVFDLPRPYGAGVRIFDSVAILPRHLLERQFKEGKLAEAWSLSAAPGEIAGLGPFRLKSYTPGQRIVLERNPYYWKVDGEGKRLPYLDNLLFLPAGAEDVQVARFIGGDTQILQRLSAHNFTALAASKRDDSVLADLGPSLEYNFLFFNLNAIDAKTQPALAAHQRWFLDRRFRQAVSLAIDRDAIVKIVYEGKATPLSGHVSRGNKLWFDAQIPPPRKDVAKSRRLLMEAGFRWDGDGRLLDANGALVEFTILTSSSNTERTQMAAVIQEDLKQAGIAANVVPFEFRSMLDRILRTHDYEAGLMALGGGDPDPNAEMNVWTVGGGTHFWNLNAPASTWEQELDSLMRRQLTALDYTARKRDYDRVQEIVARELPVIPLVSPHVLVAAKKSVGNFRPVVFDHNTLWNAERLFLRGGDSGR